MLPSVGCEAAMEAAARPELEEACWEEEAKGDCAAAWLSTAAVTFKADAAASSALVQEVNGAKAAAAVALADDSSASRASREASAELALPRPAEEEARCMPLAQDREEEDRARCTPPRESSSPSSCDLSQACKTARAYHRCLYVPLTQELHQSVLAGHGAYGTNDSSRL